MKNLIILCLILLSGYWLPAQQLYVGAGIGFRTTDFAEIDLDSIILDLNNNYADRYIIPSIQFDFPLTSSLTASLAVQHASGSISLSAYNLNSDTCALCPLRKGSDSPYREITLMGGIKKTFYINQQRFFMSAGLAPVIRYHHGKNYPLDLPRITPSVSRVLEAGRNLSRKNYLNYDLQVGFIWRKWQAIVMYQKNISHSVTTDLHVFNQTIATRINQKIISCHLYYGLTGFK